ncbi:MAG: nucleotidyltransferase domain-containing protein [Nanoarchaeota archaeon]|nr:nucleotidyltransferase domain-containing protein [Nanoarchaeota archaeon]
MRKFWRFWFWKTKQEKKYIKACLEAYNKRFGISPDKILSVYVGGSFARRELVDKSDIDFFIIIKNDEDLAKLIKLRNKELLIDEIEMCIHIYSLGELESQEFKAPRVKGRKGPPREVLADLTECEFLGGTPLDLHGIAEIPPDDEMLRSTLRKAKGMLIKQRGEVQWWLKGIAKHMFLVVHFEARVRLNQKFHFHRKKLLRRFGRENDHIIHLCDAVMKNPESFVLKKDEFVKKVKEYLDFVERNYFNL